ncbi:ROK family protein [Brevibacillus agri]|uniref:ROK family protein n=1 Tax=Brevibacillus agri TaxID=51101 RepID=UPI0030F370B1
MARDEYAIGLDLGGTKILAGLVHSSGKMLGQTLLPTASQEGAEAVIDRVLAAIEGVLAAAQVERRRVRGVGIASAGVIDSAAAEVIFAGNLGWRNVPIGRLIADRFGLPVRLMNDANAAAVAEWMWGAGKGTQNMIYVTVSTGVGAGIISGGQLVQGAEGGAGEFGHISIDWNGPLCGCGNRGCLELYASGTAIEKLARKQVEAGELVLAGAGGALTTGEALTAKAIGEAALAGDRACIEIVERAGFYLGVGTTSLIHLFNPEVIVFGGGVMNASSILLAEAEKSVRERCIPSMANQVKFALQQVGVEAGAVGAAGSFFSWDGQEANLPIFKRKLYCKD